MPCESMGEGKHVQKKKWTLFCSDFCLSDKHHDQSILEDKTVILSYTPRPHSINEECGTDDRGMLLTSAQPACLYSPEPPVQG